MSVLLLRLAGPMQSWGVQSRFDVRDTGLEPSKSGVVGLLCAALGRRRPEPIDDLAGLAMGVRVDCEGRLLRDYHTAGKSGYLKASGRVERKKVIVSTRYYLADARFLVGLEGEDPALLASLHRALRDPHWALYLGRKAFPPAEPIWLPDGLRLNQGLLDAFKSYPWLGVTPMGSRNVCEWWWTILPAVRRALTSLCPLPSDASRRAVSARPSSQPHL